MKRSQRRVEEIRSSSDLYSTVIGDGSDSSRIQTQSLFSYFLSTAQCGGTELSTNKENHTGVGRKEESKSKGDGTLDPKGVTSDTPKGGGRFELGFRNTCPPTNDADPRENPQESSTINNKRRHAAIFRQQRQWPVKAFVAIEDLLSWWHRQANYRGHNSKGKEWQSLSWEAESAVGSEGRSRQWRGMCYRLTAKK
ncbi:hypothetical protein GW17_00030376 [Ensete ventricosum]|nr:hypothetical protein GW17_00030376 [Ensete ventricosum]